MILVADSGSTKTSWASTDGSFFTDTPGFNPFFYTTKQIEDELGKNPHLLEISSQINKVFFYGAGCSHPSRNTIVARALEKVFSNATIHVDHDLLGCVRATCNDQPGICAILGTGSNCVFFDGKETQTFSHALGYILGDEGSGAYLGKQFLADYINASVPEPLNTHLKKMNMTKEGVLNAVYYQPNPNRYLASFAKVLGQNKKEEYVQNLVIGAFKVFIEKHILLIPGAKYFPVHFVGSIAHHFKKELEKCLSEYGLKQGVVIQDPIQNLVQYHLRKHEV